MPLTWQTSPTDAWVPFARDYANAIRRGVREIADRYAPEIEAHMKREAIWTDRTGQARQTLTARVEQVTLDMIEIQLRGGADHSIYLELAMGGRWAIIGPTIDVYGPRIWADVRRMLS